MCRAHVGTKAYVHAGDHVGRHMCMRAAEDNVAGGTRPMAASGGARPREGAGVGIGERTGEGATRGDDAVGRTSGRRGGDVVHRRGAPPDGSARCDGGFRPTGRRGQHRAAALGVRGRMFPACVRGPRASFFF